MKDADYANLDPVRDHELIVKTMLVKTWTFDLVRATELALLKTFSIPSIARILVNSQEFLQRSQKRYDDTDLLLALFIEHGYSSREGLMALQRINRMHARHPITNEQMLYVLATFVVEPIQWIAAFGRRPLSTLEREAMFQFWLQVGKRMGIRSLFKDLPAMLAYHERYEAEQMVYHEDNAKLYGGMLPVVAKMMPWPLSYVLPAVLPFVMSPRLCAAFNLQSGHAFGRRIVQLALRARAHLHELLPHKPHYRTKMARPTYPNGFEIKELGVAAVASPSRASPRVSETAAIQAAPLGQRP